MRIREENRNIVLLATVTVVCGLVAGTAALFEPATAPTTSQRQIADSGSGGGMDATPVRVVGGSVFVPNVNPRER